MNHFAPIAVLCLLAGLAHANTFELSDPANEMYQEQPAADEEPARVEPAPAQAPAGSTLCTIDTADGSCSCIDTERAKKLSISQQECVEHVLKALDIQQP